jgi:hypothetical protein
MAKIVSLEIMLDLRNGSFSNSGIVDRDLGSRIRHDLIDSMALLSAALYDISYLESTIAESFETIGVMWPKGGEPYIIWYRMQPKDHTSDGRPNLRYFESFESTKLIDSGDMKLIVPV